MGQPTNLLGQSLEAVGQVTFNLQAPSSSNTYAAQVGGSDSREYAGTLPDAATAYGEDAGNKRRPHHQRQNLLMSLVDSGIGLRGVNLEANLKRQVLATSATPMIGSRLRYSAIWADDGDFGGDDGAFPTQLSSPQGSEGQVPNCHVIAVLSLSNSFASM